MRRRGNSACRLLNEQNKYCKKKEKRSSLLISSLQVHRPTGGNAVTTPTKTQNVGL
jgi:hypothetical protein